MQVYFSCTHNCTVTLFTDPKISTETEIGILSTLVRWDVMPHSFLVNEYHHSGETSCGKYAHERCAQITWDTMIHSDVTQHCYKLYVYAIASFITNKNLKSLDKYNLCVTLYEQCHSRKHGTTEKKYSYKTLTSILNICGKMSTIKTSYVSLQGFKYEAIFPLFLSNICRKNCILQSVLHPIINSHNLAWWVE